MWGGLTQRGLTAPRRPETLAAILLADRMQSVQTLPLTAEECERIRQAFGETCADLPSIKSSIQSIVLPRIQAHLQWTAIRAIKGRVNDWRTVELKYNSLWHRDRHVYGAETSTTSAAESSSGQNLSAVVYLDHSRLGYIEGSAVRGQPTKTKELSIPAGTVVIFPSCLIHRAVASAESKQRRTIVLFDIENPDEPQPLVHDIVTCPGWTQKPLLDNIFSPEGVEEQMLQNLLANRPYFWRYFRRGANRRVHWQVTTAADDCRAVGASSSLESIGYNTSFYLIAPDEYPTHVRVHDHRGTPRYIFNLVKFHLGFEVLA